MKIMLDCSPAKIHKYSEKYDYDFWQLRTPLTKYALSGKPYGLDNGCFSRFPDKSWRKQLDDARLSKPIFCTMPDIVGDARRTVEMFEIFKHQAHGLPLALVLQDGIGNHAINWNDIDAVFVGGSDKFKYSDEAVNACKAARMLGKWIHVGRVNTAERVDFWIDKADSLDGSGISRYDHMLEAVLKAIRSNYET